MTFAFSPAQLGLGSLCALLAASIVYELSAPLPEFSVLVNAKHARITMPDPPSAFSPPPAAAFAVINERPIFSPGRKPVAPKPVGVAAAPPPPPSAALVGVIMDSHNSLALVRTAASPLEVSVGLGGNIAGWQVTQIEPDRIVLRSGATDDVIKLESNRASDKKVGSAQQPQQPMTSGLQPPGGSVAPSIAAGPNATSGQPNAALAGSGSVPNPGAHVLPQGSTNGTDKQN